jgi:hypothetical protein
MTASTSMPWDVLDYLDAHGFVPRPDRDGEGWHDLQVRDLTIRAVIVPDEGASLHVLGPGGTPRYSVRFTHGTPEPLIIAAIAAAITFTTQGPRRRPVRPAWPPARTASGPRAAPRAPAGPSGEGDTGMRKIIIPAWAARDLVASTGGNPHLILHRDAILVVTPRDWAGRYRPEGALLIMTRDDLADVAPAALGYAPAELARLLTRYASNFDPS